MRKLVLSVSFLFAFLGMTMAQGGIIKDVAKPVIDGGPVMSFPEMIVDYGTIEQHGDPLRVIEFTNTGDGPLVIKSARGSCGCTVPTWQKEPIMPGETSKIEIRYDTKRLGKINKTVTITTNELTEPHVLKVIGLINKVEDAEAVPTAPTNILNEKKN